MHSVITVSDKLKELGEFIDFVKAEKGLDLNVYRSTFIKRRLMMRMGYCNISAVCDYIDILRDNSAEWDNFLKSLSINVSEFFRDKDVFDFFYKNCLEKIVNNKMIKKEKMINFWSAGCSHGEEPYTLAIMLLEFLKDRNEFVPRVLATDIDAQALDIAKEGLFKEDLLKNVSPFILRKYFTRMNSGRWAVNDSVKKIVSFRKHNLFDEPLFKYMDVVFCRNVRIYFDTKQAHRVLWHIRNSLRKGGYLVLGKVETMPSFLKKYFVVVEKRYKIFQKN